jgi:hypothetical protein
MKSVRIPDRQTARAVALALFAADPTCTNCKRPVEKLDHATVLFFNAEGKWKLLHSWRCTLDAIMRENQRLAQPAILRDEFAEEQEPLEAEVA